MPRPRKRRTIAREPRPAIYKPAGVPLGTLHVTRLLPEELEALRLADREGLTQAQAAEKMGISRSTFQRIVTEGRYRVALALSEGHALEIEGTTVGGSLPRGRGGRRRRPDQGTAG